MIRKTEEKRGGERGEWKKSATRKKKKKKKKEQSHPAGNVLSSDQREGKRRMKGSETGKRKKIRAANLPRKAPREVWTDKRGKKDKGARTCFPERKGKKEKPEKTNGLRRGGGGGKRERKNNLLT